MSNFDHDDSPDWGVTEYIEHLIFLLALGAYITGCLLAAWQKEGKVCMFLLVLVFIHIAFHHNCFNKPKEADSNEGETRLGKQDQGDP